MNYEELKREFIRGYACCLAALISMNGMVTTEARELFGCGLNIPLSKLREYCDPQDYEVIENNYGALNS